MEEVDGPAFRAAVAFAGPQPEDVDGIFGYVDPEMLGISASLAEDLRGFQRWWDEHSDSFGDDADDQDAEIDAEVDAEVDAEAGTEEDPAWAHWRATGWQLVERLQGELGPRYEVTWAGHSRP